MGKPLPAHAELVSYNHAVAGHDGTLCDVDGELFIKPCTQAEIDFYETSIASHPAFAEYMPIFLGVLTLDDHQPDRTIEQQAAALLAKHHSFPKDTSAVYTNGTVEEPVAMPEAVALPIAKHTVPEFIQPAKPGRKITTNQAIVLENAGSGFVKPNILDVKLGVRLWAEDAHPDKKARYEKVTEETTHKEFGFRIAGMRVWQGHGASGKDIDQDGYRIFDKNYGRFSLQNHNVHEAFKHFIFAESAGIDEELGQLVSQAFLADVKRIQKVLEGQESRMFSASLLFVFEGDGIALRAAMEEASSPATLVNGDGPESEEDDEDEPTGPKIYSVKVIDFAHAEWTPGQGPDENSLVGVRSVVKILESLGGS